MRKIRHSAYVFGRSYARVVFVDGTDQKAERAIAIKKASLGHGLTMKVSEVMTRRTISVSPEATIRQAIDAMLENHISGLPVIDDNGDLIGIVSEGDFLRRPETGTERRRLRWLDAFFGPSDAATDYVRSHGRKVREVMTREPVTVEEDAQLNEVVQLMETHNVKRLPVIRHGKVVGIVSRANLMRALASIHRAAPAPSKDNAAIRDGILGDIAKQSWSSGATIDVVVRDGVVDLWGTITDIAQREALRVLVENTPGVRRLEDHLIRRGESTVAGLRS